MNKSLSVENLIGAWRLINFVIINSQGESRSWGENPKGFLLYTKDGGMSVSIVSDSLKNAGANISDHVLFYAGTFKVEGSKIYHKVNVASAYGRIGQVHIREAQLTANHLTLIGHGEFGTAKVVWQKLHNENELFKKKRLL